MQERISIAVGSLLQMKKPHPCGGSVLRVLRVGSDLRLCCVQCGRDMTVPRIKLERSIRAVLPPESQS